MCVIFQYIAGTFIYNIAYRGDKIRTREILDRKRDLDAIRCKSLEGFELFLFITKKYDMR